MKKAQAFGVAKTRGQRKAQEDYVIWTEELLDSSGQRPKLTVVADGMGGHAAGDVASRVASNAFVTAYRREPTGSDTVLREALEWANEQLADHMSREPESDGMGCTLVALEIEQDGSAYRWLSVGDSMLISITPDSVVRLNADHSYREERRRLEEVGESVADAPSGNVLRSAVMGSHIPLIDDHSAWRAFSPGERLVIATDGLDTLSMDEIARIVREREDAIEAADTLISAVEAAGKPRQDNTTAAVIHGPPAGMAPAKAAAPIPPIDRKKKQRIVPPSYVFVVGLVLGILLGGALLWAAITLFFPPKPDPKNAPTAKIVSPEPQPRTDGPSAAPADDQPVSRASEKTAGGKIEALGTPKHGEKAPPAPDRTPPAPAAHKPIAKPAPKAATAPPRPNGAGNAPQLQVDVPSIGSIEIGGGNRGISRSSGPPLVEPLKPEKKDEKRTDANPSKTAKDQSAQPANDHDK